MVHLILPAVALVVLIGVTVGMATRPDVRLVVSGGSLEVRLGGWEPLFCLRRRLVVPAAHVHALVVVDRELLDTGGASALGTALPGLIRSGTFGRGSVREFWSVRRAPSLLVVELTSGAPWHRLVLEVDDPAAVARQARQLLRAADGVVPLPVG